MTMSIKTLAALAAVLAAAPLAAQTPISPGQTVTGTLDERDRRMEGGAYYDAYVIRGRPGQRVVVRMSSDDFDTYLHWGRGSGGDWDEQESSDDDGEGTDSRLVVQLDAAGGYELRAAGFDEEETGEYQLRVSAISEPRARPVRVGETVEAELSDDDYEGAEGPEDHYVIRATPGTVVTLTARSENFDAYLVFGQWQDGRLEVQNYDDDSGGDTDAQLRAEFFFDDAEHHIVVQSFGGAGRGAYVLTVEEGDQTDGESLEDAQAWADTAIAGVIAEIGADSASATDFEYIVRQPVAIGAGRRVRDALIDGDAYDDDGRYFHEYTYTARRGERLVITVAAEDLDTFVQVGTGSDVTFELIAEDDDSGDDLDARLEWTAPRAGEYTIRVTTAGPEETGEYELLVQSNP